MHPTLFKSLSVDWATPTGVYEKLNDEFHFDLDPCPLHGLEDEINGLLMSWAGKRVFCNPPYGPQIGRWLEKAHEPELAVFLIPARTDTRWFHNLVLGRASDIRFIRGRLKFGNAKSSAPFPSMVVVYRTDENS